MENQEKIWLKIQHKRGWREVGGRRRSGKPPLKLRSLHHWRLYHIPPQVTWEEIPVVSQRHRCAAECVQSTSLEIIINTQASKKRTICLKGIAHQRRVEAFTWKSLQEEGRGREPQRAPKGENKIEKLVVWQKMLQQNTTGMLTRKNLM